MPAPDHHDAMAAVAAMAAMPAPQIGDLLRQRRMPEARRALSALRDPEIADTIAELGPPLDGLALRVLPRDRAADVFAQFDYGRQEALLRTLNDDHVAAILNEMDPDDRVELFEDAPEPLVADLLALLKPDERELTRRALAYPEQTVGRLATPDYMTLRPDWTAQQALDHLRKYGMDAETLHTLYLTDDHGRLLDHIRLRQLVTAAPQTTCDQLRPGNVVSLNVLDDREQAVRVMERYDLPVLPVVDDDGLLTGIVTFDDVADVASAEATEDIHKLGGVETLDEPYASASLLTMLRKRGLWLMILFVGGLLTVTAMGFFHRQLREQAILALFVPLIIASGGNSGTQAATLIVRSLATGELQRRHWARVLGRELVSGLALGSMLGLLALIVAALVAYHMPGQSPGAWQDAAHVGLAIGTAVLGVVLTGVVVGAMLPLGLASLGLDPATCSTPFVATLVDVIGLVIYFTVAVLVLGL